MTINDIAVALEDYADEIRAEYDRETAKRLYKLAAQLREVEAGDNQATSAQSGIDLRER